MTREQLFAWAEADGGRWEFDGFEPVAMTGGSVNHSRITRNLHAALGSRLRGSGCESFGPDAGVATVGDIVRYPDALVTCTPSVRRYVILEHASAGAAVLSRVGPDDPWTAATLTADDTLHLPEIGIEIPVSAFYDGVDLPMPDNPSTSA
jgi:Putative restriction endonuclease